MKSRIASKERGEGRTGELPHLTVIVPCRNEERFIGQCLDSILGNDYPAERLEIFVVDGMSADATCSIVSQYAKQHGRVVLLHNQKKITPAALNLGLASSTGQVICRIDAHARVAPDYLRRCVERLLHGDADNVGGAMRTFPSNSTLAARSIALCMSHRFGAGNSSFRTGSREVMLTDTVFGGCYRRETVTRIGGFNEQLPRTQDIEFNQRLRKSGGKILLDPAIQCDYFAPPDLLSFVKRNCADGKWSILPFAYSGVLPVRWRHLVPLAFVAMNLTFAVIGFWLRPCWVLWTAVMLVYAAASIGFSVRLSIKHETTVLVFTMPLVFAVRHVAYGFGSFCAVIELLAKGKLFAILLRFARLKRFESVPTPRSTVE